MSLPFVSLRDDYVSVNLPPAMAPFCLLRLMPENGGKLAGKLECRRFGVHRVTR